MGQVWKTTAMEMIQTHRTDRIARIVREPTTKRKTKKTYIDQSQIIGKEREKLLEDIRKKVSCRSMEIRKKKQKKKRI